MRVLSERYYAVDFVYSLQHHLKSVATKIAAWKLAAMLALILVFSFTIAADNAEAQQAPASFVRNRGNPTLYLNNVSSLPAAAAIGANVMEAEWVLEPVPGEAALVHIQNVKSKLNLHTQNGIPELGIVTPGSTADGWQVEPVAGQLFVRIKSVTTGLYLALQEVTGPLSLVPLNLDAAAAIPPPAPTAEWEFISAATVTPGVPVAVPLATAAPVAFATVAPFMPPTVISSVGACRGGHIFFHGDCVCPRDTVNIGGRCRLARFACNGGDIIDGECICSASRLAVQTGPRELSCLRLADRGFGVIDAPPTLIGRPSSADVGECDAVFQACDRAGEPLNSCRASRQSCLTRKQDAAAIADAIAIAAAERRARANPPGPPKIKIIIQGVAIIID